MLGLENIEACECRGCHEIMAESEELKLCKIALVPFRLSWAKIDFSLSHPSHSYDLPNPFPIVTINLDMCRSAHEALPFQQITFSNSPLANSTLTGQVYKAIIGSSLALVLFTSCHLMKTLVRALQHRYKKH